MHRPKPHVRALQEKELLEQQSRLQQVGPQIAIQPTIDRIFDMKRIRIREDRNTQIEKDNLLLLGKIMNIMKSDSQKYDRPRRYSQYEIARRKQQKKIEQENMWLLKKISNKKSYYNKQALDREWSKTKQYFQNLGSMRSQSQTQKHTKTQSLSFAF